MAEYTQEQDELIDAFWHRFRRLHAKIEGLQSDVNEAEDAYTNWRKVKLRLRDALFTGKEIMDEMQGIEDYLDDAAKMAALDAAIKAKGA